MQQILNSQERNQAFLKFLLFFAVTLVLALAAIFFNYRLPFRENKWLQNELDNQRQADINQRKFTAILTEADSLLSMLDKPGVNVIQVDAQLTNKLSSLAEWKQTSNTPVGKMNQIVIDKMYGQQAAVKAQQASRDKINQLLTDNEQLKNDLRDCKSRPATITN